MATLVLQYAGQALGGMIAGPVGAVIGRAAGAIAGNMVDQSLLGALAKPARVEGPRLDDLQVQASREGAFIPRAYGRVRLSGQIIWATRFEEEITTTTKKTGGKGGAGARKTRVTEYNYYANFAVGLCEGEIGRIGRIWADGKPLDQSALTLRVYTGSSGQMPDSLISAKEGADAAPAYRGLAYVVFERLPLAAYGNRIPQLAFEIFNPLDDLEPKISGVNIIPGSTEFGYAPEQITRDLGAGSTGGENTHSYEALSDWSASMDDLAASCPKLQSAALVVSWFGNDLRCGQCAVKPGVENLEKTTRPESWAAAGLTRSSAHLVSQVDGRPAFGGSPSDSSVIAAIKDIRARGWRTVFYPFIMLDVPDGNMLPDPYTGTSGQPVYPWRGRITCDPAPGRSGTADKTAAATGQVNAFFGNAAVGDFAINGETVTYGGPDEWSLRRMILHYAHLCKAAGGVEAFLVGSELRGLTTIRDSAVHFPAVEALKTLAADVRAVLGAGTKISYAADWSEYFGYHPQDGSNDVFFHLDPLWADANVDFIGIDNYMPMSDWRDDEAHLDAQAGASSIYDTAYLRANIAGGEGYAWYYADPAAREAQIRTPITDGAYAKPWVFRYKDIRNWWSNAHHDRPGGVENTTATPWAPQSKPVWFTETGCPAINKGANQPNVFMDVKSSESAAPYFSNKARDDLIQRRYLKALYEYWDVSSPDYLPGSNPVSDIYNAPMVDIGNVHIWAWDARPFPAFPRMEDVWADAPNWQTGHWLNGRLGALPLDALVSALTAGYGVETDTASLEGLIDGYVVDRTMSARQALEPLSLGYFFDAVESGELIRFSHRKDAQVLLANEQDFAVKDEKTATLHLTRAQESELPATVHLSYIDPLSDYRSAAVEARRLVTRTVRTARADLPFVTDQAQARQMAEIWLQEIWLQRERAKFVLPPHLLGAEPGDVVAFTRNGRDYCIRISEITDGLGRSVEGTSAEASLYSAAPVIARSTATPAPEIMGPVLVEFMDLPLLTGSEIPHAGYLAAFASPWPGSVAIYRGQESSDYELNTILEAPATMGETLNAFYAGPTGRWDRHNSLQVKLYGGALQSIDALALFAGGNAAAIRNAAGAWEIVQFSTARLIGTDTYELSMFLRGQAGTETAMGDPLAAGARFVLLTPAVEQIDMSADELGLVFDCRYGPLSRDMGDPVYQEQSVAFNGRGLKPLSPVHIRARQDAASDDITLSWIRRARVNADSWALEEVPLGEDAEGYRVKILDPADQVVRTLETASPFVQYTSAMQIADFGAVQTRITVEICQLSQSYGCGTPRRAVLDL